MPETLLHPKRCLIPGCYYSLGRHDRYGTHCEALLGDPACYVLVSWDRLYIKLSKIDHPSATIPTVTERVTNCWVVSCLRLVVAATRLDISSHDRFHPTDSLIPTQFRVGARTVTYEACNRGAS